MDKHAALGELLCILACYEKGRARSGGCLRKRYMKSLGMSIRFMGVMLDLLDNRLDVSYEAICPLYAFIEENTGLIFPSECDKLLEWGEDRFPFEVSDDINMREYQRILDMMRGILHEITVQLTTKSPKRKQKIIYLLFAFHNLPKVYLESKANTLYHIGIPRISTEAAHEYASFYLKLLRTGIEKANQTGSPAGSISIHANPIYFSAHFVCFPPSAS